MDIDLRRLGMGAQLQIALALVGRGAERRDNHGRRGADCPCIAARRRGLTYGQLVAQTTEAERRRIVDKYRRGPKRKENKGR